MKTIVTFYLGGDEYDTFEVVWSSEAEARTYAKAVVREGLWIDQVLVPQARIFSIRLEPDQIPER